MGLILESRVGAGVAVRCQAGWGMAVPGGRVPVPCWSEDSGDGEVEGVKYRRAAS